MIKHTQALAHVLQGSLEAEDLLWPFARRDLWCPLRDGRAILVQAVGADPASLTELGSVIQLTDP